MPREYWLIIDKPLFDWFPYVVRKRIRVKETMEYYDACERYVRAKAKAPPNWKISLGVTAADGSITVL
jgi:hypothetical protein